MRHDTFEGLRGYLALWVLLEHTLWACGYHQTGALSLSSLVFHGEFAVKVFMLLSGFVMTRLLASGSETPLRFLTRRFFRIYPVYLLALALGILTQGIFLETWQELPFKAPHQQADIANFAYGMAHVRTELMPHLLLVQTVMRGDGNFTLLGPAWSLSLEWQFYLLAPALVGLLRRWPVATAGIGLLATIAIDHVSHNDLMLAHYGLEFWIGMISAVAFDHGRLRQALASLDDKHVALFALLLLAVCGLTPNTLDFVVWVVVWAVAMRERDGVGGPLRLIFTNPVSRFLGRISYSVYLLHFFCLLLALRLAMAVAQWGQGVTAALVVTLTVGLSVGAGWLSLVLVELPGIALGKMLVAKRGAAKPGAA